MDLKELVGKKIGLFDARTDKSLRIEAAADISSQCSNVTPPAEALLLYTTDSRGRIVQILETYGNPEKPLEGAGMHFHVPSEMFNPKSESVVHRAQVLGLSADELYRLAVKNLPK